MQAAAAATDGLCAAMHTIFIPLLLGDAWVMVLRHAVWRQTDSRLVFTIVVTYTFAIATGVWCRTYTVVL